jgi:hypothetical protein
MGHSDLADNIVIPDLALSLCLFVSLSLCLSVSLSLCLSVEQKKPSMESPPTAFVVRPQ